MPLPPQKKNKVIDKMKTINKNRTYLNSIGLPAAISIGAGIIVASIFFAINALTEKVAENVSSLVIPIF